MLPCGTSAICAGIEKPTTVDTGILGRVETKVAVVSAGEEPAAVTAVAGRRREAHDFLSGGGAG